MQTPQEISSVQGVASYSLVSNCRHIDTPQQKQPPVEDLSLRDNESSAFAESILGALRKEQAPIPSFVISTGLFIEVIAGDWLFIDGAYSFGKSLRLTQTDSKVGGCTRNGCSIYEKAVIQMDDDDITAYQANGLEAKIVGKRGSVILSIPKEYFQGFQMRYKDFAANCK